MWRCLLRYTSLTQADKISDLAETNCASILCVEIYCIRLAFGEIVTSGDLFYFFSQARLLKSDGRHQSIGHDFFYTFIMWHVVARLGFWKWGTHGRLDREGNQPLLDVLENTAVPALPSYTLVPHEGNTSEANSSQGTSRAPIDHPPRLSYRHRDEFWACYERKPSWNWPTIVNWTFRRPKVVRQRILHACASSYPALNKS